MRHISTGSVFQKQYRDRKGVQRKSKTWSIRYYARGEQHEEATGKEGYAEALATLRNQVQSIIDKEQKIRSLEG